MKAKDFRALAEKECAPYAGTLALTELVYGACIIIISLIGIIPYAGAPLVSIISLLIAGPLTFSFVSISKKVKDNEKPKIEDIFLGFNRFSQAFVLNILTAIFIILWTLLLIVPGIIKSYSYACALYISHDDPNKSAPDAINESKKMMHGYKWKLFCLDISYIGWYLLCILTLGILSLWVIPKHRQARYNFYLNVLKNPIQENK